MLIPPDRLGHLAVEVVTLTGTLAYARKYGNTAVLGCYVVDKLLNKNRFTNARTAEQTDFSAFQVRRDKVNDFNSRFKNLS